MTTDALAQLALILDALDAREQQARGHVPHVPVETDRQLRARVEVVVGLLTDGGGR